MSISTLRTLRVKAIFALSLFLYFVTRAMAADLELASTNASVPEPELWMLAGRFEVGVEPNLLGVA